MSDVQLSNSLDSGLVMAEQIVHDVVDQSQSVGDISPSDALATKHNHQASGGEGGEGAGAAEQQSTNQGWSSAGGLEGESHTENREVTNGLSDVRQPVFACLPSH